MIKGQWPLKPFRDLSKIGCKKGEMFVWTTTSDFWWIREQVLCSQRFTLTPRNGGRLKRYKWKFCHPQNLTRWTSYALFQTMATSTKGSAGLSIFAMNFKRNTILDYQFTRTTFDASNLSIFHTRFLRTIGWLWLDLLPCKTDRFEHGQIF